MGKHTGPSIADLEALVDHLESQEKRLFENEQHLHDELCTLKKECERNHELLIGTMEDIDRVKKQIAELERIVNRMEDDLRNDRLGAKADLDFHNEIVRITQNQVYIHIVATVYDLLQEEIRIAWGGVFNNLESKTALFEQHKKILSAIKKHDPKEGRRAAREHLDFAEMKWGEVLLQQTY